MLRPMALWLKPANQVDVERGTTAVLTGVAIVLNPCDRQPNLKCVIYMTAVMTANNLVTCFQTTELLRQKGYCQSIGGASAKMSIEFGPSSYGAFWIRPKRSKPIVCIAPCTEVV